jgi:NAD-dependent SIR2 family protein deacetylase
MPSNPSTNFTLITQNIDGLSQQALDRELGMKGVESPINLNDPFQPPLYEMHGRLFDVQCTDRNCGHVVFNTNSPICPALSGTEMDVAGTHIEKEIPLGELPRCEKCGSLARPGVVWFGETPRYLNKLDALVSRADLCLVVGTSSTVSSINRKKVRHFLNKHDLRFTPQLDMRTKSSVMVVKWRYSTSNVQQATRTPTSFFSDPAKRLFPKLSD